MKGRRWVYLLIPVLIVVLIVGLYPLGGILRLMERAGISPLTVRRVAGHDAWQDPLGYTDGYEWVILQVDPNRFSPPEGWSAAPVTLAELQPDGHPFARSFWEHEALPDGFSACFFSPIDPGLPFEEREWLCFLYDGQGTLALYRGFLLYGF